MSWKNWFPKNLAVQSPDEHEAQLKELAPEPGYIQALSQAQLMVREYSNQSNQYYGQFANPFQGSYLVEPLIPNQPYDRYNHYEQIGSIRQNLYLDISRQMTSYPFDNSWIFNKPTKKIKLCLKDPRLSWW